MSDFAAQNIQAGNAEEVAVIIDGERFRYWTDIEVRLSLDSIDTFALKTPFQPDVSLFRDTFKPFSYKSAAVYIGGDPIINGILLACNPVIADSNVLSIGGYSLPGILQDCQFPVDAYPIEYNDRNLQDIANTAAEYFGLSVQFDGEPGANFDRVAAEPDQTAWDFLIELARQRGLIVSNTPEGNLLFTTSQNLGGSIAALKQGSPPLLQVSPTYDGQRMFSSVTGLSATKSTKESEKYTVENSLVQIDRPFVFTISDADGVDIQTAVKNKASRMFGEAVAVDATVQGWRAPGGQLWQPGNVLTLEAKGAMIYNETELMIRNVTFRRDVSGDTALMDLVFPETFRGEIPGAMPWE